MNYLIINNENQIVLNSNFDFRIYDYDSYTNFEFDLNEMNNNKIISLNISNYNVDLDNHLLKILHNENELFIINEPILKDKNGYTSNKCYFEVINNDSNLEFYFRCNNRLFDNLVFPLTISFNIVKVNNFSSNESILENKKIMSNNRNISSGNKVNHVKENIDNLDVIYNIETKEILVRKKTVQFIEKLLSYIYPNISHDELKSLLYRESTYKNELDIEIKNYYDAYVYLVSDYSNLLLNNRLSNFLYLITNKTISQSVIANICTYFYNNKNYETISFINLFHLYLKETLSSYLSSNELFIVSFMLTNFALMHKGIPGIVFYHDDFNKYQSLDDYEEFFNECINKNKFQEVTYYNDLKEISLNDIKDKILEYKEELIIKYHINHIYVFGSFSKDNNRIDSDIDLFIEFSLNLSSNEIEFAKDYLKNKFFNAFNRNIDIKEKTPLLNDQDMIELSSSERIF